LRGSGRFREGHGRDHGRDLRVSIPFIAGQWSLRPRFRLFPRPRFVSIPFIAGQWSLRAEAEERARKEASGLNPLHCGAVVASQIGAGMGGPVCVSIPFIAGQWSLLRTSPTSFGRSWKVSIPFIAGQWSLPI